MKALLLRWALVPLVLVPFACGAVTKSQRGDDGGQAGQKAAAVGQAGTGGTENLGGSPGGVVPGGAPNLFEHSCSEPELDPISKLVWCAEGYAHRPEAIACDKRREDETGVGGAPVDLTFTGCEDGCDSVPGGVCVASDEDLDDGWECAVGCLVDADCPARQFCLCGELGGTCSGATCRTDSDCGEGLLCASDSTCGGTSLRCQHPDDQCASDLDCDDQTCTETDGFRTCADIICG